MGVPGFVCRRLVRFKSTSLTDAVLDGAVERVHDGRPAVRHPVRLVDGLPQLGETVVCPELGQVQHRRVIVFVVDFQLKTKCTNAGPCERILAK